MAAGGSARARPAAFTVVVCTRERPAQLARTLDVLLGLRGPAFPVVVVDQSPSAGFAPAAGTEERLDVVRDGGRGLSRARNLGAARAVTPWVAFVDDDCRPEPDWAERLSEALAACPPEVALVSGHTGAEGAPQGDYLPVSTFAVERERVVAGRRRIHPGLVGFGVCMTVRRETIEALGGWDERLGPGAPGFPAADDMDFNYRLLRSGRAALLTPAVRARHDQWRTLEELPTLYRGYLAAWSGFALKHLRGGDVRGGLWLWAIGVVDVLDMAESALRRRSWSRAWVAAAKLAGLLEGTARGLARHW